MKLAGVALAVTLILSATAGGADEKRVSPHEQVSATVVGRKVTVTYGRPSKKGRLIFGGLVPYDEVWRTGADEATTLTTDGDLTIGTLRVPKGTYGLFTLPGKDRWTLIVNKTAKQWGAFSYKAKDDLGRVPMVLSAAPSPVEQLTIDLLPVSDRKATLKLSWDKQVVTVALTP